LLLALCHHGAKHAWERLGWVCDVAELLGAHSEIEWDRVIDRARALGAHRTLLLGLALAHELVGGPVPGRILRGVRNDGIVGSMAAGVRRELFRPPAQVPPLVGLLRESLFHLRVTQRPVDRARYVLLAAAPNARDWRAVRLPAPLGFLYYLVRPVRMLLRYISGAGAADDRPARAADRRRRVAIADS
jgi:hypothetical protein